MPGSPVVTEIHVKASNKGGRELGPASRPVRSTKTRRSRRRPATAGSRKERVAVMLAGGIAVSLITFVTTAAVGQSTLSQGVKELADQISSHVANAGMRARCCDR